ncbi:hypothetical protein LC586_40050, partial [Nostoc sp. CHAB 5714]|nr:hypothetical protein [Nostoc favosum CHAB5714]
MRLTVLGEATVSIGGHLVPRAPTNFLRIVTYILLESNRHSVSRAKLAQILWSETDQAHASMNLRQSLARIRRFQEQFGITLIESDAAYVRLNLASVSQGLLEIDLVEFFNCAEQGGPESALKISELYHGDLLAQNEPDNSDFDEWLDIKRAKLRDDVILKIG